MAKVLNFRVIIEQDEDGVFVASVPAISGCHTQGSTYEEALKNITEAIELCLEVAKVDEKYRAKIDTNEQEFERKFIGVTKVPIKISFSL